jgi:hypothetical protein
MDERWPWFGKFKELLVDADVGLVEIYVEECIVHDECIRYYMLISY